MNIRKLILLILFYVSICNLYAIEGMWLPILLKKYNIEEMERLGFKLTAEDIYDINNACLNDAVVGLVRLNNPFHHFCSGEIISNQGLVLTNHHCGMGTIQSHSTVENDYLTNGFWAMSKEEELTATGIGMCFLKKMEDVTEQVLANIPMDANTFERDSIIEANILTIEKSTAIQSQYQAEIKPYFSGNEYYLSVYEIFRDIRLVGAPPSAIGKFGGDTDNWMWPRHTGDFTMFRIYANKENKPAEYSSENVPYKPVKFLEISMNGVKKGDFTMVLGYPGTTTEYLPSYAIKLQTEQINPVRIKIRTKGLEIMKTAMNENPETRIKYAEKAASMANGWKKWMGENRGLKRIDAINKKIAFEKDFEHWVNETDERKTEYKNILLNYKKLYDEKTPFEVNETYFYETINASELVKFSSDFIKLFELNSSDDTAKINSTLKSLKSKSEKFYKNYDLETDKKLFAAYIEIYYRDIPKEQHPKVFEQISSKFNCDFKVFADYIYTKSMFPYPEKTIAFIDNYSLSKSKKLAHDPIFQLQIQALNIYRNNIYPPLLTIDNEISELNRLYMKALMEFNSTKSLFPDANSTFRVAYGQVDDYKPIDAVSYFYQTTLKGIIEKDNPDIYDYDVPEKLKELYYSSDFGNYGNTDSSMPVCFIASNHTTGGNSGSPVLNGKGQLIGINFDRNWEGTMSDIMYDPEMCRNIALDIRYVLFIVDKFAGAGYLINEMKLVNEAVFNPNN